MYVVPEIEPEINYVWRGSGFKV